MIDQLIKRIVKQSYHIITRMDDRMHVQRLGINHRLKISSSLNDKSKISRQDSSFVACVSKVSRRHQSLQNNVCPIENKLNSVMIGTKPIPDKKYTFEIMSNNVSQLGNNIDWVVGNIFLFSNVNLFIRKRKILPTHIKEILQMNIKQTQQERKSNLHLFFFLRYFVQIPWRLLLFMSTTLCIFLCNSCYFVC